MVENISEREQDAIVDDIRTRIAEIELPEANREILSEIIWDLVDKGKVPFPNLDKGMHVGITNAGTSDFGDGIDSLIKIGRVERVTREIHPWTISHDVFFDEDYFEIWAGKAPVSKGEHIKSISIMTKEVPVHVSHDYGLERFEDDPDPDSLGIPGFAFAFRIGDEMVAQLDMIRNQ